jgi:hypothetical protein
MQRENRITILPIRELPLVEAISNPARPVSLFLFKEPVLNRKYTFFKIAPGIYLGLH